MMRKTLHKLLVLLLLIVAFTRFSVASSGIAVTLIDYRFDTTQHVNLGYTLTVSARVSNTDTTQLFAGYLDFGLRNDNADLSSLSLFDKPPYSGNYISLGPGEAVPAVFNIDITDPYFAPGPDVVVVWPISNSPISDSILIHLTIEDPSGLKASIRDNLSYLVFDDRILLSYSASEMNFQQVRIFNVLGQQATYIKSDFITEIPIPNLPKGIYLCEMITADKKTRVIKFYH